MKGNKKEKKVNKKLRVIVCGAVLIGVIAGSAAVVIHNGGENVKNNVSDESDTEDLNEAILTNEDILDNNIIFKTDDGKNIAASKKEDINVDKMNDGDVRFYYTELDDGSLNLHFMRKTPDMTDTLKNILKNKLAESTGVDIDCYIIGEDETLKQSINLGSYEYDKNSNTVVVSNDENNKNLKLANGISSYTFDDNLDFYYKFLNTQGIDFDFKTSTFTPVYEDCIQNRYLFDDSSVNIDNDLFEKIASLFDIDGDSIEGLSCYSGINTNEYTNIQDAYISHFFTRWDFVSKDGMNMQIGLVYSIW